MSNNKEYIKFKGKLNTRFPQLFPKNNKKYKDNTFAILNMDLIEIIDGNVEENKYGNITIKGFLPYICDFHKVYVVLAEVTENTKWGKQNNVLSIREDFSFENIEQQKIFLQTFLNDNQIRNLYDKFDKPIDIISQHNVKKLCDVKGIGEKIANKIIEKYDKNVDYTEAYIELSSYGLTPTMIKKLVDGYSSPEILINKIKKNPYIIASEVSGIGFDKCDKMALNSGMNKFSQYRLRAFISYILNEGAMQGYSWISSEILINKIEEELDDFSLEDIVQAITYLKEKRIIWNGKKGKVALQKYYNLEKKIKNELLRIKNGHNNFDFKGWEKRILEAEKLQGWKYTDEQKKAIKDTLKYQINIITGLGGTGKTATAFGAIKALGNISFAQCCLAGKASAKMQEATGYEAYTIHRLLGFSPRKYSEQQSQFLYNKKNPMKIDVILCDEFPMIGGKLFLSLLEAIPTGSKLLLLGDMGQLPAIGALNIGVDLTESKQIHTNELIQIHRQAQKSAVITESIKIRHGEQITNKDFVGKEIRGKLKDLELDIYNDKKLTVSKIIEHFKEKLKMSNNNINEVQIILPMNKRGESSVYNINNLIQNIYNPSSTNKKEVFLSLSKDKGYTLKVGDKIINMVNNYNMPIVQKNESNNWEKIYKDETNFETIAVFNGFTGKILDIYKNNLIIYFPLIDKTILVDTEHWKKEKTIHLAYALSTYKTQGSNYDYPIIAIDYSHYIMLSRELVYTAITRSSKYCTLVAENKALRYAITQTKVKEKQTFLKDMLDNNIKN